MRDLPPFVFVGGCERSGTTLVQKVLCAHGRVAGGPEFLFTADVVRLHRRMSAPYPGPWAARRREYFAPGELAAAFRRFYCGFFRRLADEHPGARYLSEKTPSNIAVAGPLLELFPDGRFVHVLRDGRDVLLSHREVERRLERRGAVVPRTAFRLRSVAGRWNRACEAHRHLRSDSGLAERYLAIRFEDLVRDPESTVGRLFGFLGLEPEPACLRPGDLPAADLGLAVDGAWITAEMDRRGFDPGRIGRWRRELGTGDRLLASVLMAGNLRRLEYPVSSNLLRLHRLLPRKPGSDPGARV